MALISIPTSKDIYIEVNGRKLAVVQSYIARTSKTSKSIECFGSENPVATVSGKISHDIELKKVLPIANSQTELVDFYNLTNFNLMIVKPDSRIIYSGCEWSDILESVNINEPCIESVRIVATKRIVM